MADDIYVVERILNKRIVDNDQVEYFLKWFGYDEEDATWEPEENVFCKDLIEQYEYNRRLEENRTNECQEILTQICNQIEKEYLDNPTVNDESMIYSTSTSEPIESMDDNHLMQSSIRTRKRTNTNSLTRKKKLRSDTVESLNNNCLDENANDIHNQESENETPPIDYLSLEPERIVSITRSRTPSQQLEFLLKCTRRPTKLYFISNEKAKELVPDLLIDFYERHINWFIDRPTSRSKTQKRKS